MENTNQTSSIEQNKKNINWGSGIITGVLALLIIVSLVQISQSVSILKNIKSNNFKANVQGDSSNNSLPSNLQNLPNMVGGC